MNEKGQKLTCSTMSLKTLYFAVHTFLLGIFFNEVLNEQYVQDVVYMKQIWCNLTHSKKDKNKNKFFKNIKASSMINNFNVLNFLRLKSPQMVIIYIF